MKEESGDRKHDNSCGVVGVVLGILSLIFVIMPFVGAILGVVGVIFSYKQNKIMKNKWAVAGIWMCWIAIVLNMIWNVYYIKTIVEVTTPYVEQMRALQASGGVGAPA